MSGITHGMDIEGVRRLASQMNSSAEQIGQLTSSLSGALDNTEWRGPDAERFRDEWRGTYVGQLNGVVQALQNAATAATGNADAQEQASGG